MTAPTLTSRLVAEFAGTGATGDRGGRLRRDGLPASPHDIGLQLLANFIATAFALGALILMFGPASGAHFNPVVLMADWWLGRRTRTGLTVGQLGGFVAVQTLGAVGGAVLANLMFALPAVSWSSTRRSAGHLWLGEVVATVGLVVLVFAL